MSRGPAAALGLPSIAPADATFAARNGAIIFMVLVMCALVAGVSL